MQLLNFLRYLFAGRPPRNVVLKFVLALVALIGHVLRYVQRRTRKHVGHWKYAGSPGIPPLIHYLWTEQVGVFARPGDVQVVAGN